MTKKENMWLIVGSEADEFKIVKLETSRTVILPVDSPMLKQLILFHKTLAKVRKTVTKLLYHKGRNPCRYVEVPCPKFLYEIWKRNISTQKNQDKFNLFIAVHQILVVTFARLSNLQFLIQKEI